MSEQEPIVFPTPQGEGESCLKIVESRSFNPAHLMNVLERKTFAYRAQYFLSPEVCAETLQNFLAHPGKRIEAVDPPIVGIGRAVYEFPNVQSYFQEADHSQRDVNSLFPDSRHPFEVIIEGIRTEMGAPTRPLIYHGQKGCYGIIRSWEGKKDDLAALIHEDASQYQYDAASPFNLELRKILTHSHISVVLCLANEGEYGGETRIYDYVPPLEVIQNSDLRSSYGYKPEAVEGKRSTVIRLNPGELLVFPGDHLHSVTATTLGNKRVTVSMFMAYASDGSILYWS